MARSRLHTLLLCALTASQPLRAEPVDPANPTCPLSPSRANYPEMRFTVQTVEGHRVLLAEGLIDSNLIPRLEAALQDISIEEIRLRSPGGDARVGNQAGLLIRRSGVATRIPAGWACAGFCAFMFLGGISRIVEPGGLYILQMFTFTGDRETIRREFAHRDQTSANFLTDIARQSAELATEDNDYLMRVGVSRSLLTDIVYRQRAVPTRAGGPTWRCLTDAELRRYYVVPGARPVSPPAQ